MDETLPESWKSPFSQFSLIKYPFEVSKEKHKMCVSKDNSCSKVKDDQRDSEPGKRGDI